MSLDQDAKEMAEAKADLHAAAKDFQFSALLKRFTRYSPPVIVHANGDLKARIDLLRRKIEAINVGQAARSDEVDGEESLVDEDPLAALVAEHDKLVADYDADVVEFKFRPSVAADWDMARAQLLEDQPDYDQEAPGSVEALYPYLWAATSVDPVVAVEEFRALKELIGDAAMGELHAGWLQTNNGGGDQVDAPFSRSSWDSHTRAVHERNLRLRQQQGSRR